MLGTIYGGDGRTTFALPDLRGRAAIHMGRGPGLSDRRIGSRGGAENTILNVTNLPSHNHTASIKAKGSFAPPTGGGTLSNPNGAVWSGDGSTIYSNAVPNVDMSTAAIEASINNTGGGQ